MEADQGRIQVLVSEVLVPRGTNMDCPKCQSGSVSVVPAEIRLYRNSSRTMSHPPVTPSPDVCVCLDCGWAELSIPQSWLLAGWLRPLPPERARIEAMPSSSSVAAA